MFHLKVALTTAVTAMWLATLASASEFDRQCHKLLPEADSFYDRCQNEGVPFGRTFYPSGGTKGEHESFRVLFSESFQDSQFVMGCVLMGNFSIVGIYYKTTKAPLPPIKPEYIQAVDFQGNVGLKIDGKRRILLAVEQIVTDKIPARYEAGVRNCEIGDFNRVKPHTNSAWLERGADGRPSGFCYGYGVPCELAPYAVFFGDGRNKAVFMPTYKLFVDADGALMVEQSYRDKACAGWHEVYGPEAIVLETCASRK
ncbi:hypothetical protein JNB88_22320 [Rhizobium cauense]|uniref:hypothetical protein n=1 Tax=Rhizobium cauense TaxID=1166683 RepID=UPI001C6F3C5F|nr:hypothetical protein [Rhizobium cauense]MBW9116377.1 hypothetical protein [Rhizobium cauense]